MPWFALARVVVVGAVAYAAAALQPLPFGVVINTAFAIVLAVLVVLFETRLRETQVTRLLGGLIGFIVGIATARAIEAGFYWLNSANQLVEFFNSFLLIVLPYLGLMLGVQARGMARAGAAHLAFSRRGTRAPLQKSSTPA
jgi:uncharacterized protein YacL